MWDCGSEWLDDYTYYAEVIGDEGDNWWGTGMAEPSNGDSDIPQPKVYRSYQPSTQTMLQFVEYAFCITSTCSVDYAIRRLCRACRSAAPFADAGEPPCARNGYKRSYKAAIIIYRDNAAYSAAIDRGSFVPEVKWGWAVDDGSGDQVFGDLVYTRGTDKIRRRKFGKILKLKENGLITDFGTLPNDVERDGLYPEAFDAKYFEPTFEAAPFMATFDTNKPVNIGGIYRTVRLLT
jgi:hypothetical protein